MYSISTRFINQYNHFSTFTTFLLLQPPNINMKYSYIAAALAAPVLATPVKRQGTNIDTVVLQFALTLEHLENVFYKGALQKFSAEDFQKAGYGATYYNNLKYIASDEQSHVQFLSSALTAAGATPVAACQYNFPYTDVNSFITLSSVLEGVGTSAYLGGAPLITSKAYLTAAGSILVTEALHTSFQRGAVSEVPFPTPYGTPLDPTSVFTLAAAFIKSCPSSNYALPFKPYPALTLKTMGGTNEQPQQGSHWGQKWNGKGWSDKSSTMKMDAIKQGATISLTSAASVPKGAYLTFVSGLTVVSVPASANGMDVMAAVPNSVAGQVYVFVTSAASNGTLMSAGPVAGPAIVEIYPPAPMIDYSQA